MSLKQLRWTMWVAVCVLITACAQKTPKESISPALEGAQRLERRAHSAYGKGDLLGAQKDYQTVASVYTSLALPAPLALVQLNLAKIEGESGRTKEGLALAESVLVKAKQDAALGEKELPVATRQLAHGRAAALSLALAKTTEAQQHLAAALALCGNDCDSGSALAALQAEVGLQAGDASAARAAAERALQLAKTDADRANALRSRAAIGLAAVSGAELASALQDAQNALAIDQQLGAAARVIADLALLEKGHAMAGNSQQAERYKLQREAAQAAREQLRLK